MKTLHHLKALGFALCVASGVAGAASAYAQNADTTDTTTTGDTAAPANNAKATRAADRKLGRDVRRALARAQGFDVSNVFVRARSGAVTLTGSVPDGGQIQQAADIARGVPGVKSVSNKITLGVQSGGGS